jgi:pyridinium-3,5-bisthiocarboxylic acid mononucleotide nickel chelatase
MRIAYLDCQAGISGNMFLGGLISLGLPQEYLAGELSKLGIWIPPLTVKPVNKKGIEAILFETGTCHEHHHRHLSDINNIINLAQLSPTVKESALGCFMGLAVAEAKIHGVSVDEVHFHEVGAVDAIVDIVGACIGLEYLRIDKVIVSPIRVGFGTVTCAHGVIPLPAPAAMELLTGFTVYGGEYEGEWTTPTGAAILKNFTKESGSIPEMKIVQIGYGAGGSERAIPNVLRIILGDDDLVSESEIQIMIETNIDDMNPELYSYFWEKLLEAGARDCYLTPIYMKKGRPGVLISVIVPPERVTSIEKILFSESTTLGIRKYPVWRNCMTRELLTVQIDDCRIGIKVAISGGQVVKYAPEYEDCLKAAKVLNRSLKDIYEVANIEARKIVGKRGKS